MSLKELPHNGRINHRNMRVTGFTNSANHGFTNRPWSPPRVFANAKTKIATVYQKVQQRIHSIVPDNGHSNTNVVNITIRATNKADTMVI